MYRSFIVVINQLEKHIGVNTTGGYFARPLENVVQIWRTELWITEIVPEGRAK